MKQIKEDGATGERILIHTSYLTAVPVSNINGYSLRRRQQMKPAHNNISCVPLSENMTNDEKVILQQDQPGIQRSLCEASWLSFSENFRLRSVPLK